MSIDWKIAVPREQINYVKNPILGDTGEYGDVGLTPIRDTGTTLFGTHSLSSGTINSTGDYVTFLLEQSYNVDTAATNHVTFYLSENWSGTEVGYNGTDYDTTVKGMGDFNGVSWYRYTVDLPTLDSLSRSTHPTTIQIKFNQSSGTVNIDGVQLTQYGQSTPLFGSLGTGYTWKDIPHNSASIRSASADNGGQILSFRDDLSFKIEYVTGASMPAVNTIVKNNAGGYGGVLNQVDIPPRDFELRGTIIPADSETFNSVRARLLQAFSPMTRNLRRIIVENDSGVRYIDAAYVSGLDGTPTNQVSSEDVDIRLIAPSPFFTDILPIGSFDSSASETASFGAAVMSKTDGEWAIESTGSAGNNTTVAILYKDGYIFLGGDFTRSGAEDNFVYREYDDSTWLSQSDVTTGVVYEIIPGPDLTVIVFAANGVYEFDLNTTNMTEIASANNTVRGGLYDIDGNLWAVGDFSTIGGTSAQGVAYYDGSSWSAPYSSLTGSGDVLDIAMTENGTIYIMPETATTSYQLDGAYGAIMAYSGGVWSGSGQFGLGTEGNWITTDGDKLYYSINISNNFAGIGVITQGEQLGSLRTGLKYQNTVTLGSSGGYGYVIDGVLYVSDSTGYYSGDTVATELTTISSSFMAVTLPITVGEAYEPLLPILPDQYVIAKGRGSDIWMGGDPDGLSAKYPKTFSIIYNGTAPTFPRVEFVNALAIPTDLHGVTNEETGAQVLFNGSIKAGTTRILDTNPALFEVSENGKNVSSSLVSSSNPDGMIVRAPLVEGETITVKFNVLTNGCLINLPKNYLGQE